MCNHLSGREQQPARSAYLAEVQLGGLMLRLHSDLRDCLLPVQRAGEDEKAFQEFHFGGQTEESAPR
jgi:hypothetical protein